MRSMFFSQNRNWKDFPSIKGDAGYVHAVFDSSLRASESPNFDSDYEYDSLHDGFNSPKITLTNYSIDSNGLLTINSGGKIVFNDTNAVKYVILKGGYIYISYVKSDFNHELVINNTSLLTLREANSDYFFIVACKSELNILGFVSISRIIVNNRIAFFPEFINTFNNNKIKADYISKYGFADSNPLINSKKILRVSDNRVIRFPEFKVKNLSKIATILYRNFYGRYLKELYIDKFYFRIRNITSNGDKLILGGITSPYLNKIVFDGYVLPIYDQTYAYEYLPQSTIINLYFYERAEAGDIYGVYLDMVIISNRIYNFILPESGVSFLKRVSLKNTSAEASGGTIRFQGVNLEKLIGPETSEIIIQPFTGDIDLSAPMPELSDTEAVMRGVTLYVQYFEGTINLSQSYLKYVKLIFASSALYKNSYTGKIIFPRDSEYTVQVLIAGLTSAVPGLSGYAALYFNRNADYPSIINLIPSTVVSDDYSTLCLSGSVYSPSTNPTIFPSIINVNSPKVKITFLFSRPDNLNTAVNLSEQNYNYLAIGINTSDGVSEDFNFQINNIERAKNFTSPTKRNSIFSFNVFSNLSPSSKKFSTIFPYYYYFKLVLFKFNINNDFSFVESELEDAGYCESFHVQLYDENFYKKTTLPKLNGLLDLEMTRMSRVDLTKINTLPANFSSFNLNYKWSINPEGYLYYSYNVSLKFKKEADSIYLNNHTAHSIYISENNIYYKTFRPGINIICGNFYLPFGAYSVAEYLKDILDNYSKFKPRPNDPSQDTSDYAKTLGSQFSIYGNSIKFSQLFTSINYLSKPLGYIQANSNTVGNNGTIVYPKTKLVDGDGSIEFIFDSNKKMRANFELTEYDEFVKLELNVSFSGELEGKDLEDYIVGLTPFNRINPEGGCEIFGEAISRISSGDTNGEWTLPGLNYVCQIDENGNVLFNFIVKGDYLLYIFKPTSSSTIKDAIYSSKLNITSDTVLNLNLNKIPKLCKLDFNVIIDGVPTSVSSKAILELTINDSYLFSYIGVNSESYKVPYFTGDNTIKAVFSFSANSAAYRIVREFTLNLVDESLVTFDIEIDSTNIRDITTNTTSSRPISFLKVSSSNTVGNIFKTELGTTFIIYEKAFGQYDNTRKLIPFRKYTVDQNISVSFYLESQIEVDSTRMNYDSANSNVWFREGKLTFYDYNIAWFYIVLMVDVGGGVYEEAGYFISNYLPGVKSTVMPLTLTKFKVVPVMFLQQVISQYEMAYILGNQKKDNSETFKYRWTLSLS